MMQLPELPQMKMDVTKENIANNNNHWTSVWAWENVMYRLKAIALNRFLIVVPQLGRLRHYNLTTAVRDKYSPVVQAAAF